MKSRDPDPRRLDIAAFAQACGHLEGSWPLASCERLQDLQAAPSPDGLVSWSADAHQVAPATAAGAAAARTRGATDRDRGGSGGQQLRGGMPQTWLHLQGQTRVALRCQRCLELLPTLLRFDRRYLFVRDEEQAARLDEDLEDDVLVLERELDLHALVEDELLLAMPLVPMHDACTAPMPGRRAASPSIGPFASLAVLRETGSR